MSYAPILSYIELAIALERARHHVVTLLDDAVWHLDATFASTRALRVVAEAHGLIHAGEVGRRMGISRQAAAVLVKRHEEAGRVVAVDEGWARSVAITAAGREHLATCLGAIERAMGRLDLVQEMDLIELGDALFRVAQVLEGRGGPMWVPEI